MSDMSKWNPLLVDDAPDSVAESDPEIQKIMQKKQAGLWDITRQLADVSYSGTGTKAELVELEENMRDLLEQKVYGYKFIEGFLISIGYNLNKIRQTFKRLTGIDPQVYMDTQPYLDTPGSIPGINYGWGEAKGKEYDYLFIMPYNLGFSTFGQKGDLERVEVKYFATLEEAQDYTKKKVKEFFVHDPVVNIKKLEKPDERRMSENWPIGTKTSSLNHLFTYMDKFSETMSLTEKQALLENALEHGNLTEEDFHRAAMHYGIIKTAKPDIVKTTDTGEVDVKNIIKEDLSEAKDKLVDTKTLDEELEEITPQTYFDKNKRDVQDTVVPEAVTAIQVFFDELNQSLADFEVNVFSFKYMKQLTTDKIEKTVGVGNKPVEEHFSSSGNISVILDVKDKALPEGKNIKQGLSVFSIVGNDVHSSGTFKGEDGKIYGMNQAGMEEFFQTEQEAETR
jgi:hypothetical protein